MEIRSSQVCRSVASPLTRSAACWHPEAKTIDFQLTVCLETIALFLSWLVSVAIPAGKRNVSVITTRASIEEVALARSGIDFERYGSVGGANGFARQ